METREAVARAICIACDESPDTAGDARGNEKRWQDYALVADAAITAMTSSVSPQTTQYRECPCCHHRIKYKNRHEPFGFHNEGSYDEGIWGQCIDCKHNNTETNEFPCRFCEHGQEIND
jgi:hypothetical protein